MYSIIDLRFVAYLFLLLSWCVQPAQDPQHNWTLTSLESNTNDLYAQLATPAAKRLTGRLDTSPSVTDADQYQLGVRSEETDKGSESGRRRLIDWRQIHPLSTSLPLHESVKPL